MSGEVEFVSGYKDAYGKLHKYRIDAEAKNREFDIYQKMYALTGTKYPVVKLASYHDVAEYIVHYYDEIKAIMDIR